MKIKKLTFKEAIKLELKRRAENKEYNERCAEREIAERAE
jgi:hypothetical protein